MFMFLRDDRAKKFRTFLNLITLPRGTHGRLHIRPRWPAQQVRIDPLAFERLRAIQSRLPAEIDIILTRGYEPGASNLGLSRKCFRAAGIALFRLIYPDRKHEVPEIFGANGHDVDGSHIDVSFRLHGRRVRMLPLGVFTPPGMQQRRMKQVVSPLAQLRAALLEEGFRIHGNPTESLQIHCDLLA
jgi:hypothetical protein